MRILIDGVFFQINDTGIARLWMSLFREWSNTDFAERVMIVDRDGTLPDTFGLKRISGPRFSYRTIDEDRDRLQELVDQTGATHFTSTYFTFPRKTASTCMVYDMIPEVGGMDLANPMWQAKHAAIRAARSFITISRSTARDLQSHFPAIDRKDVTVAHCGVDLAPVGTEAVEEFRRRLQLDRPYFLLVGASSNYKNPELFFRSFSGLGSRRADYIILSTGRKEPFEDEFVALAGEARIVATRLSDQDLRAAYEGAVALVYPSFYEGFGLPVAEAMACGCPVITTNVASIPEVAGEAALFVDPHDIQGLTRALQTVQDPAVRSQLVKRGLKRAKTFKWSKMAQQVREVLEKNSARTD